MLTQNQKEQLRNLDALVETGALKSSIHFQEYSEQRTKDIIAGKDYDAFPYVNQLGVFETLLSEIEGMQRDIINLKLDLVNETTRQLR